MSNCNPLHVTDSHFQSQKNCFRKNVKPLKRSSYGRTSNEVVGVRRVFRKRFRSEFKCNVKIHEASGVCIYINTTSNSNIQWLRK